MDHCFPAAISWSQELWCSCPSLWKCMPPPICAQAYLNSTRVHLSDFIASMHKQSSHPCEAIIILGFEIDWITGDVPAVPSHIFEPRISLFVLNRSSSRSALPLETERTYMDIWMSFIWSHLFWFEGGLLEARLELAQRFAKQSRPRSGCSMEDCGFVMLQRRIFGHLLTLEALSLLQGG